jgi:hypothetical protein
VEWLFLVVGGVVVFAIAAAFVGSEAFRLGHSPQAAIFDLDEAVDHVADGLPDDVQARLSYDDVRVMILATLEHLEDKGLSAMPGAEPRNAGDGPPVVVADDEAVAFVLGALEEVGVEADDTDVFVAIGLLLDYLRGIGAFGPDLPRP